MEIIDIIVCLLWLELFIATFNTTIIISVVWNEKDVEITELIWNKCFPLLLIPIPIYAIKIKSIYDKSLKGGM